MTLPLHPFFRLSAHEELASTNDEALARARRGAPEGTLILADTQTAGRGRRGRRWESPAGNLYLSIILRPPEGVAGATAVGFAAALAVRAALVAGLPSDRRVELKWPNDVLIDGAKAAGLLIEAAEDALVLGVGINILQHPSGTPYPATSLQDAGGSSTREDVLSAFCAAFKACYDDYRRDGFAPIRAAWLAQARGIGGPVSLQIDGARFDGIFRDIDTGGALVLDLGASGVKTITAGDVSFAPPVGS